MTHTFLKPRTMLNNGRTTSHDARHAPFLNPRTMLKSECTASRDAHSMLPFPYRAHD